MIFNCEICGKEKKTYPSKMRRFCSFKCMGIANKGKIQSEDTLEKRRISMFGKNKGNIPFYKGKKVPLDKIRKNYKHSEATKIKIGLSNKNNLNRKITRFWLGKKRPDISGANHANWQGGITPINAQIRNSLEYKLWRKAVFERDKYTCVSCGVWAHEGLGHAVTLHADHIKPFALFQKLRLDIDNGRTMCEDCHRKTDTFAGRIRTIKVAKLTKLI